MSKWADYVVTAVIKNDKGVITHLRVAPDNGDGIGQPTTKTEAEVIQLIDNKKSVITIVWDYTSSGWQKGEYVKVVQGQYRRYLRTHRDNTVNDNLDHLLRYDWV